MVKKRKIDDSGDEIRFQVMMQALLLGITPEDLKEFYDIVKNSTAAEVIFKRANAEAPMMGLTSFKGDHPTLRDAQIAKNYLNENELKILNNLVSGYFDFAEIQAMKRRPMYMNDYVHQLDTILSSTGEALLTGSGSVSHQQAIDKAREEYRKFQVRELSPVEQAYLETIKVINSKAKNRGKIKQ